MKVELTEAHMNLLADIARNIPLNMNYEGMKTYMAHIDEILAAFAEARNTVQSSTEGESQ